MHNFFQALTLQLMLSWKTNLSKKQKYFPNSKSVLYTKIKVYRNKYKGIFSLYLVKKTQGKKKGGSSIILFLELLHTRDEKLEQKKIGETAEINLCSQSLRVKKFNSHLQPQPIIFVLLPTLRSQPPSHTQTPPPRLI